VQPKAPEWDAFYAQMKRKTNLDLHKYKPQQLQRRIIGMMESKNTSTLDEFWATIVSEREGITWFMDRLAINVSELFRNPEKWEEMRKVILPDLLTRSKTLKCWSAGCSIGAEAHSLAMILDNDFRGNHTIVGSDIDQAALSQAKSGEYGESEMRCVPADLKAKYFLRTNDKYFAKPELKKSLSFKTGDLLADRFDTGFDLIMCRNVVIYFTDEAKDELYRRFYAALKPGGFLFVGSTERIFNSKEIGYETPHSFYYQKPNTSGDRQWRSAS
jgi:chemotaxis protein methyltransferase CheR